MEGKLQVELAQLSYLLPRLVGQWKHLERLGGGIGTRGPGETQLESDRRMIRHRIEKIRGELGRVRVHRRLLRDRRKVAELTNDNLAVEDILEEVVGEIEEGPAGVPQTYRDPQGRLRVRGTMRLAI